MTIGSTQHIILFLVTAAFIVLSCLAVSKMSKFWQNVMFVLAVLICMGGIFFRYAMKQTWGGEIDWKSLCIQMLQVCNFNFILLPLMLIPKFKLARQYSIFFAMFAASTTLFALNTRWAELMLPWYHPDVLSSWIYHTFAIVCPLWMLAAGRLRPERKYVLPVSACVFGYFSVVYTICEILKGKGIIAQTQNFSYIYNASGTPLLTQLFDLIGVVFWYLAPAFVVLIAFFYAFSMPFTRRVVLVGNGGVTSRNKSEKKRYGTVKCDFKLSSATFKKQGAELIGWSDTPDTEAIYTANESIIIGKENIQLYAVWSDKGSEL